MSAWLESLPWWQVGLLWVGGLVCGLLMVLGVVVVMFLFSDWRDTREWKRNIERVRNQADAQRSGT